MDISSDNTSAKILVVEDDADFRAFIVDSLDSEGYIVTEYDPVVPDENVFKSAYDLVISDIVMPGINGFEICRKVRSSSPDAQIIIMTGYADREKLDSATDIGAYTFLVKPFRVHHIKYAVLGALRVKKLVKQNLHYKAAEGAEEMGLIGSSKVMKALRDNISDIASLNIPVLITGESGTGKEIAARCIHRFSPRSGSSFIPLNCASLPSSLIESELFGYASGAFTGARKSKHGFFKAADGGTLFLDEIGDLPLEMQTKLLRVLDNGEFTRLGETEPVKVNVRIISATNRDLEKMVDEGSFRKDLYYRLSGGRIRVPSLDDRKEDIPSLACYFTGEDKIITTKAQLMLQRYEWKGNVRELKMAVEKLAGLSSGKVITEDLVCRFHGTPQTESKKLSSDQFESYRRSKDIFDKSYFASLMSAAQNNITKASKISGIDRKNLREKLKKHGIYEKTL